jgi:hypothetical protein
MAIYRKWIFTNNILHLNFKKISFPLQVTAAFPKQKTTLEVIEKRSPENIKSSGLSCGERGKLKSHPNTF